MKTIEEQKQTVIIEKWLISTDMDEYKIVEASADFINSVYPIEKIKLLETYEVEL